MSTPFFFESACLFVCVSVCPSVLYECKAAEGRLFASYYNTNTSIQTNPHNCPSRELKNGRKISKKRDKFPIYSAIMICTSFNTICVCLPFNPALLTSQLLLYIASRARTAFNSSANADDDNSLSSLLVEDEDPSPSSRGWRGGAGGGAGPPHSPQEATPPRSSSRYRHSS